MEEYDNSMTNARNDLLAMYRVARNVWSELLRGYLVQMSIQMHDVLRTLDGPVTSDMGRFLEKLERKRIKAQRFGVYVSPPPDHVTEEGILAFTPLYETADTNSRPPVVAVTNPQPLQNTPLRTVLRTTPPPLHPTTLVPTTTRQETTRPTHGQFYMTSQWWDP